jgi:hypothetical protein
MKPIRLPTRPTKRAIAARLAFMGGSTQMPAQPKPRKRAAYEDREESSNDQLKEWRRQRGDVRLWRNNVGAYPLPSGGWLRYGLCPGSADFIGLYSLIVRPEHVGKRVAVLLAIESKARGKDAEDHQDTWLKEVIDAGAVAGVARNADEADQLIRTWELTL